MGDQAVERPGHAGQIERVDEQRRGLDLPAARVPMKRRSWSECGRPLHAGCFWNVRNDSEVTLGVDDPLHGRDAQGADQLVLQVGDADEEPESLHAGAREVGAEAGPLERALEMALLPCVAEAREPEAEPRRAEPVEEAADGLRTPDRDDGDALGVEIPTAASGKRLERALVADPLDEHDRPCGGNVYVWDRVGHVPAPR